MTAKIEVLSTATRATRVTSLHAPTPLPAPPIREGLFTRRCGIIGEVATYRNIMKLKTLSL